MSRLTARRLPLPCLRKSSPPGPRLLLLDFLRLAASVLVTSTVAFSFSIALRMSVCELIDLRMRRVAGTVASAEGAILVVLLDLVVTNSSPRGDKVVVGCLYIATHPCLFTLAASNRV